MSVAAAEEAMATMSELASAPMRRESVNTVSYQRSEGPLKGGTGSPIRAVAWLDA